MNGRWFFVLKVMGTYTLNNDCDMAIMLLPLQGNYISRLTPNRALPYPIAQAPSGQKKI
jgi:hypothetical protein